MSAYNASYLIESVARMFKTNRLTIGSVVEKNTPVNTDAGIEWIGIYKGAVNYTPRTLGRGARNWQNTIEFRVIVQNFADDYESGEQELEGKIANAINVMESDRTLGGKVSMINGYGVDYGYDENDNGSFPFQYAVITVSAESQS